MKHNIQTNVDENITKARCSAYSLFGCGFHGHNGLDPESLLYQGRIQGGGWGAPPPKIGKNMIFLA